MLAVLPQLVVVLPPLVTLLRQLVMPQQLVMLLLLLPLVIALPQLIFTSEGTDQPSDNQCPMFITPHRTYCTS